MTCVVGNLVTVMNWKITTSNITGNSIVLNARLVLITHRTWLFMSNHIARRINHAAQDVRYGFLHLVLILIGYHSSLTLNIFFKNICIYLGPTLFAQFAWKVIYWWIMMKPDVAEDSITSTYHEMSKDDLESAPKCDECPAYFKTFRQVHFHKEEIHGWSGANECKLCKFKAKKGNHNRGLRRHMDSVSWTIGRRLSVLMCSHLFKDKKIKS